MNTKNLAFKLLISKTNTLIISFKQQIKLTLAYLSTHTELNLLEFKLRNTCAKLEMMLNVQTLQLNLAKI